MKFSLTLDRPTPIWVKAEDNDAITKLRNKLKAHDIIAIDTETTGLNITHDIPIFWSLSTGDDRYFLEADTLSYFQDIFEDPNKAWVQSQIKFDTHMLANHGYLLKGDLMCTLVMDRLANSDENHGLKEIYEREFDERISTFQEVFYPKNKQGDPKKPPKKEMYQILMEVWEENPQSVIDYASLDAWAAFRVYKQLKKSLSETYTIRGHSLWQIFMIFEVPFTRVLYSMEREGILIDTNYLELIIPQMEKEQDDVLKTLTRKVGAPINPNSAPQVSWLLFEKMKLQPLKLTKGGTSGVKKASVDESTLSVYANKGVEEAALILTYRGIGKSLKTYVHGLLDAADNNGRVHTTFNQDRTETGRLSSTEPNLQLEVVKSRELLEVPLEPSQPQRGSKGRARRQKMVGIG